MGNVHSVHLKLSSELCWIVQGYGWVSKVKLALQVLTNQKPTGCLINQAQK